MDADRTVKKMLTGEGNFGQSVLKELNEKRREKRFEREVERDLRRVMQPIVGM